MARKMKGGNKVHTFYKFRKGRKPLARTTTKRNPHPDAPKRRKRVKLIPAGFRPAVDGCENQKWFQDLPEDQRMGVLEGRKAGIGSVQGI